MDELRRTAQAYHSAAPENIKQMANEFYAAMDKNNDGQITLPEYLAFMKKEEGHSQMRTREFFTKLDKRGNGLLAFSDIITLYYIINSGRPFCDACGDFISGQFFTCTKCFDCCRSTFNVCSACFFEPSYVHDHNQFLDNFVLLETKRTAALKKREEQMSKASSSQRTEFVSHAVSPVPYSGSNAIVLAYPQRKRVNWTGGIQALAAAVSLGSFAANCSIM